MFSHSIPGFADTSVEVHLNSKHNIRIPPFEFAVDCGGGFFATVRKMQVFPEMGYFNAVLPTHWTLSKQ